MLSYHRALRHEGPLAISWPIGCRYGSECKYRHMGRARSRPRSLCKYGDACRYGCRGNVRVCHNFRRGGCTRRQCGYIHDMETAHESQMQHRLSVQPRPAVTAPVEQPLQARPAVPGPADEQEAEPEDEEVQSGPSVVPPVEQAVPPRPAVATPVDQPVQRSPERDVCVVCYAGRAEVAYSKCGHMCICKACSGNQSHDQRMSLRKCPICRRISPRIIIFPMGVPAG